MVIFARCPICTLGMFVSSTSTSAWMMAMSASVEQHGAGVVHRADHRGLAFLNVPSRDDAVDRRLDSHFAQVVARALEPGAFLVDAAGLRRDLFLALANRRFGGLDVVLRLVERFARGELLTPQVALRASASAAPGPAAPAPIPPPAACCSSEASAACSDALPLSTRVRSDFGSICRRNCPTLIRSPSLTARLTTRPGVSAVTLTRRLG